MSAGRHHSRLFYHQGRRPRVLLGLRGQIFSGELMDRSNHGIGVWIATEEDFSDEIESYIPKLFITKTEDDFSVSGLKVVYSEFDSMADGLRLGLKAENEDTKNQLEKVLHRIAEKHPLGEQQSKLYQPDKLPSSSRRNPFKTEAIQERHSWLEEKWNTKFTGLTEHSFHPEDLAGNIENFIGAVQVPVGIAGPVLVKGLYTHAHIPVPIATTEGALVSSITRGARACALAGGIRTHVINQTMLRAPSFHFQDLSGSVNFCQWLEGQEGEIIRQAQSVSSVAKLSKIEPFIFGDTVHVKFHYSTGDAAGQNMTTACTYIACEWISRQLQGEATISFIKYNIEGNVSGDKKVNHQNFIQGRGISAVAEIWLPESILRRVLRVSLADALEGWQAASVGARQIGMVGVNINFANVIAGVFTATGQDIASVHESSMGILNMKEKNGGLYACAYLPSLVIGTVGGGTGLPTQRECLKMMDCVGSDRAFRMAEIIAATCLSLDLSTGCAIAAGHFVAAHESLGRNRPKSYFKVNNINAQFINQQLPIKGFEVESALANSLSEQGGVTASLMANKRQGSKGLFELKLINTDGEKLSTVLKLKSPDNELVDLGLNLIRLSGEDDLPGLFEIHHPIFGFEQSHLREIEVYQSLPPEIMTYLPQIYSTMVRPEQDLYAIQMEKLQNIEMMDSTASLSDWDKAHIQASLKAMAHIHGRYMNRHQDLPSDKIPAFDPEQFQEAGKFLSGLTDYVAGRFPDITGELPAYLKESIKQVQRLAQDVHGYHQTLNHGDFNPRNLCFRKGKDLKLCLYDWELARFGAPQGDLFEFLSFVLSPKAKMKEWQEYIDFYIQELESHISFKIDRQRFHEIMVCCGIIFAITRLNLYCLAHNIANFQFLDRVYASTSNYLLAKANRKDW